LRVSSGPPNLPEPQVDSRADFGSDSPVIRHGDILAVDGSQLARSFASAPRTIGDLLQWCVVGLPIFSSMHRLALGARGRRTTG